MLIMSRRALQWLVAGAMSFAFAPAWAVDTPIYKCFDAHLSLVYTDLPCKDGEVVDIRAGDADPAAVARLERARDQLDQSAAERTRDERRLAGARALARPPDDYDEGAPPVAADASGYAYGYLPAFRPLRRPHLHRPHPVASLPNGGARVLATAHVPRT
jgi:hypothetical protein